MSKIPAKPGKIHDRGAQVANLGFSDAQRPNPHDVCGEFTGRANRGSPMPGVGKLQLSGHISGKDIERRSRIQDKLERPLPVHHNREYDKGAPFTHAERYACGAASHAGNGAYRAAISEESSLNRQADWCAHQQVCLLVARWVLFLVS
jgi:hypothetical protein